MATIRKYQKLYEYLCGLPGQVWNTSFREIESVIGFKLPDSARKYPQWWENRENPQGWPQRLAWSTAGWKTAEVDMSAEALVFRRLEGTEPHRKITLDEILPVHPTAVWPERLSLRREDMYEDRI